MEQESRIEQFRVLINDEEQYSLWQADKEIPRGWRDCGVLGSSEECLNFVETHWTDMRPKSLREKMSSVAG